MQNNNHKKQVQNKSINKSSKIKVPIPDDKSVLVYSLGGVGQIGMNWTLYGYKGRWILVDAGTAFPPRDMKMVSAIYPDNSMLKDIIPRLSGLIVTHAHEDHIGAIHRMWPKIKCPIYATPFARKALEARFEDRDTIRQVRMKQFSPSGKFRVGPFDIETANVTHSAPECVALSLDTDIGTIFHTGDWKFDKNPVVGRPTDIRRIRRIGEKNVLAMVCDSTNAMRQGKSTSEADVYDGFKKVFEDSKGMVVVSCFATNVARVASIMRAAAETNREVAISGRSLIKYEKIARELGMLKGIPKPLHFASHLKGLDRRQMTLICTGTQGEENAALARLSRGDDWKLPDIEHGDVVVHSARIIPGNEDDVYSVFDGLREKGAKVLEAEYKGLPLHVTGHATSGEIAKMYGMVKPKYSVPVHGNVEHLEAHTKIALTAGVEDVVVPREGSVFSVSSDGITKIAQIPMRLQAELDDNNHTCIPWDEAKARKKIKEVGSVMPTPKRKRYNHFKKHQRSEQLGAMPAM